MVKGVIIVVLILFLLFIYSLAVTAKRADQAMAELFEDHTPSGTDEGR